MFYIYYTVSNILVKIFDLFEIEFIRNPIIFIYFNNSIGRKDVIIILILQMILAYYNNKWQYYLTARIDVLNYNDLFPIAKLYSFSFFIFIVRRYNKDGYNLAYEKVDLVEVLDIGFYDTIFGNYILKKPKLNFNNLWIFVLNPLIIIWTIPVYIELWLSFDEVGSLTRFNIYRIVYRQQSVGHIFYIVY